MDKGAAKKERFEDFLKQVEETVRSLESGNLGLEESIERYEVGMTALKRCYEILELAEKKIEQLVRQKDGTLASQPLEAKPADTVSRKEGPEDKDRRRRKVEGEAAPF